MPKGIPRAGFRRTKRYKIKSLQELERDLADKVPYIVEELEKLTKPFPCPHCGNEIRIIDKDVGMYLVDRVMGKPRMRTDVSLDVPNADRLAVVYRSALIEAEQEYKQLTRPSETIG